MGALEEEDDDIYEAEKKQDYDRSVTDDSVGKGQLGWTGPHSIGDCWTMECFTKANKTVKPAKVSVCLSVRPSVCLCVCLSVCLYV